MVQATIFSGGTTTHFSVLRFSFELALHPLNSKSAVDIVITVFKKYSGIKSAPGHAKPDDGNQGQAEQPIKPMIRNGSFEQARGDRPAGWRSNTWGGEASLSYASTGRTGTQSVLISSTAGADAAWSQTVSIEPFTRYRLSAWIKTQDLKVTNGRGAQLNIHEMQGIRTSTTVRRP